MQTAIRLVLAIPLADFSAAAEENACQDSVPGCLADLKWCSFTGGGTSIKQEGEAPFHCETALCSAKNLEQ